MHLFFAHFSRLARYLLLTLLLLGILITQLPVLIEHAAPWALDKHAIGVKQLSAQWHQRGLQIRAHLQLPDNSELHLKDLQLSLSPSLTLIAVGHRGVYQQRRVNAQEEADEQQPITQQSSLSPPNFAIKLHQHLPNFQIELRDFSVRLDAAPAQHLELTLDHRAGQLTGGLTLTQADRPDTKTALNPLRTTLSLSLTPLGELHIQGQSDLQQFKAGLPRKSWPWLGLQSQFDCHAKGASAALHASSGQCTFALLGTTGPIHHWQAKGNLYWEPGLWQLNQLRLTRPQLIDLNLWPSKFHPALQYAPETLSLNATVEKNDAQLTAQSTLSAKHPNWQAEIAATIEPTPEPRFYTLKLPINASVQGAPITGELHAEIDTLAVENSVLLPGSELEISSINWPPLKADTLKLSLSEGPLPMQPSVPEMNTPAAKLSAQLINAHHQNQPLPKVQLQLLAHGLKQTAPVPLQLTLADQIRIQGLLDLSAQHLSLTSGPVSAATLNTQLQTQPFWPADLSLSQGQVELALQLDTLTPPLKGALTFQLKELSGHYQTSTFKGVNASLQQPFAKARFTRTNHPIAINQLDIGLLVEHIQGQLQLHGPLQRPELLIRGLTLQALGGKISAPMLALNPSAPTPAVITLEQLNLEQLVALYDQPGLSASGYLSGTLPLEISSNGVALQQGKLYALPPGGVIRLAPTPALQNLKQSQPNLRFAFDLMENLHYHKLSAQADLATDGELDLRAQIQGANPEQFGGQEVHLNYNHQENIFQLLKSLQLADEIHSGLDAHFNPSP